MRILHVVPSFGLGGMEKIICAVINSDRSHSHGILLLEGSGPAMEWVSNSRAAFILFKKGNTRREFFWSLLKVLRENRPDLLMTYNWGAIDAIWLGRMAGISTIIHH